ncbi:MAG: phosphopyruvate hydratase, partial [Oscillospiraceae bacterium]|nr:phosphopyruvate hydratase [Oscillospiraceae bacterium]
MKGTIITKVFGRQVYSDRGHPGIYARVETANGAVGTAICTAGVSVGTHEIPFAYDGGDKFLGLGTTKAAKAIDELIAPAIIGLDAANQQAVDQAMLEIGKDVLGGNATAAVSAANLKAGAAALGIPLYRHIGGSRAVTLPVAGVGYFTG